jgi:hypothetical protein
MKFFHLDANHQTISLSQGYYVSQLLDKRASESKISLTSKSSTRSCKSFKELIPTKKYLNPKTFTSHAGT